MIVSPKLNIKNERKKERKKERLLACDLEPGGCVYICD